ncbi:MAG: nucleoside monophosphate kinase [Leptolyngbyaceae cyanobacterium]
MKTKQFILLGLPGVKIQDHAVALAERWQVPHISLSAIVQTAAQQATLGPEITPRMESGKTIPEPLLLKLMRRRFEQPDAVLKGWVLEGFPQSVAQAEQFDAWWSTMSPTSAQVVYIKAMTGILLNRLSTEPGQTASSVLLRQRIEQAQAQLEPLLAYYQAQDRLQSVNGSLPFVEVARNLARLGQTPGGAARVINDEDELNTLITTQPRLVVNCMASWCGSCKLVAPFVDKLATEFRDRATVVKIDFDANQPITKRFQLQGLPAVMYFNAGERLETLVGVKSYQEYCDAMGRLLQSN